ncbi:MAG: hypothetical protein IPK58_22270 [Acidobacteria bacterium]|nr:hypothetical protein [Acidobacteriota bacterium]
MPIKSYLVKDYVPFETKSEPEVEQFARIADHLAHLFNRLRAVAEHLLKSG